jgi:uncharacterized protein
MPLMPSSRPKLPHLGIGLGLRPTYYPDLLAPGGDSDWHKPKVDWLEAIAENYMVPGGAPLHHLMRARADYPIVLHGVSLSIGSTDPLDRAHVKNLRQLADQVEAAWVSDHLCWTGVHGINLHDLLPMPYHQDALRHLADRIGQVQDLLGRQLVLENVSSYLAFDSDEMAEWEFVAELAKVSDSLILLDVNNIYVSSRNHGFDPLTYLHAIPPERVVQIHVAGHTDYGDHVIDTHDHAVAKPVFDLLAAAWAHIGPVSTMIERDDHFPAFVDLLAELDHLRTVIAPYNGDNQTMALAG